MMDPTSLRYVPLEPFPSVFPREVPLHKRGSQLWPTSPWDDFLRNTRARSVKEPQPFPTPYRVKSPQITTPRSGKK